MTSQSESISNSIVRHHYRGHYYPTYPESPIQTTTTTPKSNQMTQTNATGLGLPAILFISIGSSVVLIVFIICIYIVCRQSRTSGRLPTIKQASTVGRGIQRRSFLPRFSRYRNQPVILNYPDPDSHLPNYPIRTPYTFSSSSTLSTDISFPQTQHRINTIPDVPSYRATIY